MLHLKLLWPTSGLHWGAHQLLCTSWRSKAGWCVMWKWPTVLLTTSKDIHINGNESSALKDARFCWFLLKQSCQQVSKLWSNAFIKGRVLPCYHGSCLKSLFYANVSHFTSSCQEATIKRERLRAAFRTSKGCVIFQLFHRPQREETLKFMSGALLPLKVHFHNSAIVSRDIWKKSIFFCSRAELPLQPHLRLLTSKRVQQNP